MGKSIEELRQIIQKMQAELGHAPVAQPPDAHDTVPSPQKAKMIPPQEFARPVRRAEPSEGPELPAVDLPPAKPRMAMRSPIYEEASAPRSVARKQGKKVPASDLLEEERYDELPFDLKYVWRAGPWVSAAVALAGLFLKNVWVVGAGYALLLVLMQFRGGGSGDSASWDEIDELTRKVDALQKELRSGGPVTLSGSVSRELAEEIQELRTMVRSLYKVLQEPSGRRSARSGNEESLE